MQSKINNPRLSHVGKSKQDVAAHYKFLREEFVLENTEERKQLLETTSDSTFEEEYQIDESKKFTPKPLALKITDFFKSNLVINRR